MIWFIPALAALVVVYLAARFDRFRRLLEPALSIAVALALVAAFLVWSREDDNKAVQVPEAPQAAALSAADLALANLVFTRSRPETSFRLQGQITNGGTVPLDYFRLEATLEDCDASPCTTIGTDTALIIARVLPGQTLPFDTFFTIPNPDGREPKAPSWKTRITDVRARTR